MIRRAGPGQRPVALWSLARCTRQRCCPMARCWRWEEKQDHLSSQPLLRNSTIRLVAPGVLLESLAAARRLFTATLLLNAEVLVAGGDGEDEQVLSSAELYNVGLGFTRAWQPKIRNLKFTADQRLLLGGLHFQGISQASGGNTQDSSTNYPVVQLRAIGNEQVSFLFVDPVGGWSDTSFTSLPVRRFPFGPALVTVFTNGIPSPTKYLVVVKHDDR